MKFTRITVDPLQMGGVPCIRGLRIPVATIVGMFADGMTEAEVLKAYPDLESGDVREAMRYAAEAVRERELPQLLGRCLCALTEDSGVLFQAWYTRYRWGADCYKDGFSRILELEALLREQRRGCLVSAEVITKVLDWGRPRSRRVFRRRPFDIVSLEEASKGSVAKFAAEVKMRIPGFDLSYTSKLLRFYDPVKYGVLDAVLAGRWRCLGLKVVVTPKSRGPCIQRASARFEAYAKWVHILRLIRDHLNVARTPCPHPPQFVSLGLRERGKWACADVEMALFAEARELKDRCLRTRLPSRCAVQPKCQ